MTGVSVAFGGDGIRTTQQYPSALPDLFKGDTLLAFGRYSGDGANSVKITGTVDGKEQAFAEDVTLEKSSTEHAFIPRLWATRRVGWLLDEIRLHGESAELKDEVVKLAREHGIVTPYTAYLIIEDENRKGVPPIARTFRELEQDQQAFGAAKGYYDSTVTESRSQASRSGGQAVQNAQSYDRMKNSVAESQSAVADAPLQKAQPLLATPPLVPGAVAGVAGAPATQPSGYRFAQNYAQQARVVNGRAFYQNGNTWTDATIQQQQQQNKSLKQRQVRFNSDEYFALLRDNASAAPWLSLGNDIDVVIGDTIYQVREN